MKLLQNVTGNIKYKQTTHIFESKQTTNIKIQKANSNMQGTISDEIQDCKGLRALSLLSHYVLFLFDLFILRFCFVCNCCVIYSKREMKNKKLRICEIKVVGKLEIKLFSHRYTINHPRMDRFLFQIKKQHLNTAAL